MQLRFTDEAVNDLNHIRLFLLEADVANLDAIIAGIIAVTEKLLGFPRIGVPVKNTQNQGEVRDYFYRNYCLRYSVTPDCLFILRVWHQKENERNE